MNRCDIIVPIYNAYEDTIKCVESVMKNTDPEIYRLILINDKSPDERIAIYLDNLDSENIVVLHNEKNLGFVGTVNRGMKYSKDDVLLLNSDTIVTENWLDKIIKCAYSHETVATVTPLTNNGTICSVPNFLEDNIVPEGFTLDEYAKMIEEISFKKYPSLVTGVGFCMYIKRSALDEIGFFDEEAFGKGYGEENDFCCRAIEHGYINVLCDDTFILHTGSMSFKEDKAKYIEENLKVLFDKYPYYNPNVQKFIEQNPLKEIQENIKLNIKLKGNNKKSILYLLHNGMVEDLNYPRGGTEFHLFDLVQNLDEVNRYVLESTGKELFLSAFIDTEVFKFKFNMSETIDTLNFENKQYEEILELILKYFKIDLVHVQHFKNHIINIPKITKKLGIPAVITLHDFYAICPTINLLDSQGNYCENTRGIEECNKCIKQRLGFNSDVISMWNERMANILANYDEIFTPSSSAKKIIESYYSNININIKVIEHGVSDVKLVRKENVIHDTFNIAFVGGLAPYKGSGIIHDLIIKNRNKKIKWNLFGNLGDQRLNLLSRNDLFKYGRYKREEVHQLLVDFQIDLVCIFSIWPETYAYTLTEAMQAGIPVMVYDIGALGERTIENKAGIVLPKGLETEKILEEIEKLINNKDLYNSFKKNLETKEFKSNKEMALEYRSLYDAFEKPLKQYKDINGVEIFKAYQRANLKFEDNNELVMELVSRVNALENENKAIKGTLGWKMLDKIRMHNPFILRVMKKLVYLIAKKGYKK